MNTYPPYRNDDIKSFAYSSARKRWPTILTTAIDDVHRTVMDLADHETARLKEGKQIINALTELKYAIEHDRQLEPLEDDGGSDIKAYNEELARIGPVSWLSAPWLYSECYMYRYIHTLFQTTELWKSYDIFGRQKLDTFQKSTSGVIELAKRYKQLSTQLAEIAPADLKVLFSEFLDISLWGNATDLSLLTNISLDDIQSLQGKESRKNNEKNILVNDTDKGWRAITAASGGRVDFVLDNAGFELFADIMFILFLLDSKLAEIIVLHPKSMPWFVSDTLPHDIGILLSSLKEKGFFGQEGEDSSEELDYVASKFASYLQDGSILVRPNAFWTTFSPYWELNSKGNYGGAKVWEDLRQSKLVIFKGDLNHRKLLGDLEWPRSTPFADSIGLTATNGLSILSLRTIKADTLSGLAKGTEEKLDDEWSASHTEKQGWAYSGKYAVVQFSGGR
jgi:hypothetical protein